MTPRKELFIKIKQALMTVPELELIDLERGQINNNKFPDLLVSAFIRINTITYGSMTEQGQEGDVSIDITLNCRDGWMVQHNGTTDPDHGLNEIDLLDSIAEALQSLSGDNFKPLQQVEDAAEDQEGGGMFSYRQTFNTTIYRKLNYKYQSIKIKI